MEYVNISRYIYNNCFKHTQKSQVVSNLTYVRGNYLKLKRRGNVIFINPYLSLILQNPIQGDGRVRPTIGPNKTIAFSLIASYTVDQSPHICVMSYHRVNLRDFGRYGRVKSARQRGMRYNQDQHDFI